MKNYFVSVVQHKLFYPLITVLLGLFIVYYAYTYHIKEVLTNIETVERNIGMVNNGEIKKEIKNLKAEKKKKQMKYNELLENIKVYNDKLYRDKYSVVVDVMGKLNTNSFNVYTYKLNDTYDNISLKMSGSYLNLISFLDFLQTIKANIEINTYKIELKEEKMFIDLDIKIGIIRV